MTMSRCCTRRPVISIAPRSTSPRRFGSDRILPLLTTTSGTRSSGRDVGPRPIESHRKQRSRCDPDYALAHDGLGVALYSQGQTR